MTEYPRVALTGHRSRAFSPEQAAWVQVTLAQCAARFAGTYGSRVAISGLALGADTWWALAGLSAGLALHAYVPFEGQADTFTPADRALWQALRAAASWQTVIHDGPYDVRAFHARNDAMLAAADAVVAVWLPGVTRGGAASTVRKALARGLPVLHVDPASRAVQWMSQTAQA